MVSSSLILIGNTKIMKEKEELTSENYGLPNQRIIFESRHDAYYLGLDGISNKKTTSSYPIHIEKREFHISPSQCRIHQKDKGKQIYLDIKGLKPSGAPGTPMVPMKTFKIFLPLNSRLLDVQMKNVFCQKIKNKLDLVSNSEPTFWSNINEEVSFSKTYNEKNFFPGKAFSYKVGDSSNEKYILIHLYPIQYLAAEELAVLLTDGVIEVYYTDFITDDYSMRNSTNNSNVIITPPELFESASNLKEFHNEEGTITEVVNTTWIFSNYIESDDPPFEGYKDLSIPGWERIHNYNYSLAKRIVAYLNDSTVHPDLQYVTLLGNARLVPPSYYYSCSPWMWVPTDFFYASPEYDLIPNFKVGRLPVNSTQEASHVINKIINWNSSSEFFRNITVAGGKPFHSPYDIGEMIAIDSINRGFFKGINPTKCFRTDDRFNKDNITKALMGETAVLYEIGHGSGFSWWLEEESICVDDVLSLPPSNSSPIVISIACINGKYDTHIVNDGYNISFGESLLLSDAGGIAYIGGSRPNAGLPIFTLDNGYVNISKEKYMAGMLTYVLENYYCSSLTLGDLTTNAMLTYLENNDFTDYIDNYTYFSFVLLGDPALKISPRPTSEEYQQPNSQIIDPFDYVNKSIVQELNLLNDENGMIPLGIIGENSTIFSSTMSPMVQIKIVDALKTKNVTLEKTWIPNQGDNVTYDFIWNNGSVYCIRSIASDGKEGWLYVLSARVVDDDFDTSTYGFNVTRWVAIQDAVDISNEGDILFVYNGTYNENLMIDKKVKIFGFNNVDTIIDGGGIGNVVSLVTDGAQCIGFTIQNSGISDDFSGIFIDSDNTKILNNIIRNNNFGVLINKDFCELIMHHNNFVNNQQNTYDLLNYIILSSYYPNGGNYYDNFDEPSEGAYDNYSGYNQDINGSDGIVDTAYKSTYGVFNDEYPLIKPWGFSFNKIYVDNDFDEYTPGWGITHFNTIQHGINAVDAKGEVYVANGTYEEVVFINKSIDLIGEDKQQTVISGFGTNAILVSSDYVNITGFTIKNSAGLYTNSNGIEIIGNHNEIIGNIIEESWTGIQITNAQNTNIQDNIVRYTDNSGIMISEGSSWATILDNTIINNSGIGISLYSSNSKIIENTFDNNYYSSIILYNQSTQNNITGNCIGHSNYGIYLSYSKGNTIKDNQFIENGIVLIADVVEQTTTHIIDGNTINNKPIIYLKNNNYQSPFSLPADAGQIILANCSNINIDNQTLKSTDLALQIGFCSNIEIQHSNISNNSMCGIFLFNSSYTHINDNNLLGNNVGLIIWNSIKNTINGNTITESESLGLGISGSFNILYHNNFINNFRQAKELSTECNNTWDNGYPSAGNYWSDYNGTDIYQGPNQSIPGSDGIGDIPYTISQTNIDHYPLIDPWTTTGHDIIPPSINHIAINAILNMDYIIKAEISDKISNKENITAYVDYQIPINSVYANQWETVEMELDSFGLHKAVIPKEVINWLYWIQNSVQSGVKTPTLTYLIRAFDEANNEQINKYSVNIINKSGNTHNFGLSTISQNLLDSNLEKKY